MRAKYFGLCAKNLYGKRGTKQTKPGTRPWNNYQVSIYDIKVLDIFMRKQNLKFPVTITEVVILRGLHEWIKLNSLCDLSCQTAVFDRFVSRLKFLPH